MQALLCSDASMPVVSPRRVAKSETIGCVQSRSDSCIYVSPGVVEEYEEWLEDDEADEICLRSSKDSKQAAVLTRAPSNLPEYKPLPAEVVQMIASYPRSGRGLVWHASVVPDSFNNPKHVLPTGELKPRRPLPQVRLSDLVRSLVRTEDRRFFCGGKLNGWPALTGLELRSITTLPRDKKLRFGSQLSRLFDAEAKAGSVTTGLEEVANFEDNVFRRCTVQATFWAPPWTARGYEADTAGRVFWFDSQSEKGPRVVLGEAMAREALPGMEAKAVHLFGHRYAKSRENWKDLLTYHSAVLVEWKGAGHCSVVELAWLHGLGGYGGKSNFVPDRDSERPKLYDVMPDSLKAPWVTKLSEIRVIDMDVGGRGLEGFQDFLQQHTGRDKRFLEPKLINSSPVRLSCRSQAAVFAGLVNYIRENPTYTEESHNCQTFATDLYRHLSGNHSVEPFHPVCRPLYHPRTRDFLYDEAAGP
mmetsp:Transcript_19680/g.54649  ORF Transcript_19680/g.54649 Transcript_19680/m.54649 type:complete len:473 (-) Transcript_19680:150-1568(-)